MSAPTTAEPRFLTVAQAAVALGVSGPTIRRWVAEQRLGAVQVGGRDGVLRIPVDVIERLMADARGGHAVSIATAAAALRDADEALAAAILREGATA
jgi:excisionase family DNA binding protein